MECQQERNLKHCNCGYEPCARKGVCCECIQYHLRMRELSACVFPDEVERSFDRLFERFAQLVSQGQV